MQTVARHDISLAAEMWRHAPSRPSARTDRACLFHDQKKVNVQIVPGLVTRGRAEHIEMFDA